MAKKFIVGVDLGGTNIKVGLLDDDCVIRKKNVISTRGFTTRTGLIDAVVGGVKGLLRENDLSSRDLRGACFGFPGPLDPERGIVYFMPNISGWKNVPLKQILSKKLSMPVYVDNDAKLMTLAEYTLGAARGLRNVVCLTLGTGVGGGIIIEGKLYRGSSFVAGEIGHLPLNEEGPRCTCGGIGCLEEYIGNNRIMRLVKQVFDTEIPLDELSRMAQHGDRKALRIWETVGRHLGIALSGVINLLNPDGIVVGGGVAGAGKVLFDQVKKTIKERSLATHSRAVKLLKAKLGNDAGIIGAALVVRTAQRV